MAQLAGDLREAFAAGAQWLSPLGSNGLGSAEVALNGLGRDSFGVQPDYSGGRLGDFELLGELGRGGMGVVYRARQVSLDRQVALKVLSPSARPGVKAVTRFLREGRAAGRLHHTNIVPVYAQGETDGAFYYAMELIEGTGLDVAMRSDSSATSLTLYSMAIHGPDSQLSEASGGTLAGVGNSRSASALPRTGTDYRRIATLMAEVCEAVQHAHGCGIVHRDLKPQNLLLGSDNRLHITDFGLAKDFDEAHLTLDGELMGTPAYMSPEQIGAIDSPVDYRTDIYSLGVTLYEILTLRKPFEGQTREQLLRHIAETDPVAPRLTDRRIPLDLEVVCLHALEKDPARRYASAQAMAADLRRFAENRPILTRRVRSWERCLKWARRHKAWATALVAFLIVLGLTTALTASVVAARRHEAIGCLSRAYDQLVFKDYKNTELVAADLARAENLGADPARLRTLQALSFLGRSEISRASESLQDVLALDPENRTARYMLSWALTRDGQGRKARDAFQQAEAQGGPQSPAEWFIRGLAIHREDPVQAGESYRKARELAGAEHQFFPQATLHLARSYNQQMYQSRRIERVAETTQMLRELVDYGIYGSYPFYLLSIAHRLAAEVYEESDGTRGQSAADHYGLALDWAAKGRNAGGPEPERPITAEAECLESMGEFEAAIAARTAAIAASTNDDQRHEGLGYRWRLYYWTGQFEEALEDLQSLAAWDSQSIFFTKVYPLMVHAESGSMDEALNLARSLGNEDVRDPQRLIWCATCLRLLGQAEEADDLLAAPPSDLDFSRGLVEPQSEAWVRSLLELAAGRTELHDLLALAEQVDAPWRLSAEAYFHAAAHKLGSGERRAALAYFEQAYRCFDSQRRYTFHAKIIRVTMRQDPNWPAWFAE